MSITGIIVGGCVGGRHETPTVDIVAGTHPYSWLGAETCSHCSYSQRGDQNDGAMMSRRLQFSVQNIMRRCQYDGESNVEGEMMFKNTVPNSDARHAR
jgi:hypothetical protein